MFPLIRYDADKKKKEKKKVVIRANKKVVYNKTLNKW